MRPLVTALAICSAISCAAGGGGKARDGGLDGSCRPIGGTLFRMEAPPHDGGYWYRSSFGDPGDGVWWYSVETPDGSALQIFLPPGARSLCGDCDPKAYPIGQQCSPIPDGGVTGGWGGFTVTGTSTCQPVPTSSYSGPAGCATIQCLPAGRYTVRMCAGGGPCPTSETCVDVPFDFPTDAAVVGHLPP